MSGWGLGSLQGFPKIWGTFLGVPIMRIVLNWGLYWGPLFRETTNCQWNRRWRWNQEKPILHSCPTLSQLINPEPQIRQTRSPLENLTPKLPQDRACGVNYEASEEAHCCCSRRPQSVASNESALMSDVAIGEGGCARLHIYFLLKPSVGRARAL